MRLLQLARKLHIKQQQIITFLEGEGIVLGIGSINKKVPDELVESIIMHFDPESLPKTEIPEPEVISEESPLDYNTVVKKVDEETVTVKVDDTSEEKTIAENSPEEKESVEVIRVPKIQLSGIKVVGKIELPEKLVVKVPEEESNNEEVVREEVVEKKHPKKREMRPGANPKGKTHPKRREETYEQKLKREEEKRQRDFARAQRVLKKKKKNHYLKTVVPLQQTKPKKMTNKPIYTHKNKPIEKVVNTNPFQKFWKWLNGHYDS